MKGIAARFVGAAALGAAAVAIAPAVDAVAQEMPTVKVAVLDFQKLIRESLAGLAIKTQIERQLKIYQDEGVKTEQELGAANQELERLRTILDPNAFAQKRREFEDRVAVAQRTAQARKRELDQANAYGLKEIQKAVLSIIGELAEENGLNLVLARQHYFFAGKALNIFDEVLARLNQRLPTVQLPLAQN